MTSHRTDSEQITHLMKLGELVHQSFKTAACESNEDSAEFVDNALFTSWRTQGKHFIKNRYGKENTYYIYFDNEVSHAKPQTIAKGLIILDNINNELNTKERQVSDS
jgi:hypothetical protein